MSSLGNDGGNDAIDTTTQSPQEFATPAGVPGGRRWLLIGLSVALVAAAVAAVTLRGAEPGEAVVLRHAFTEGDVRTYDGTIRMSMRPVGMDEEPVEGTMTGTFVVRIVGVHEDGSADVEVSMTDLRMEGLPPEAAAMATEDTMRMRVATDGEILSMEGSAGLSFSPGAGMMSGLVPEAPDPTSGPSFFPQLPDHEVAPGDSWSDTQEVPLGFEDETMTITIEGRHDGYENTEFGRAVRLSQDITVPFSFEFPFGEMFGPMMEGFGQMAPPGAQPEMPDFSGAKMSFDGDMSLEAITLVLVDGSDVVQMDGTMEMSMDFEFVGFPDMPGEEIPDDFGMTGTIDIEMVRTS